MYKLFEKTEKKLTLPKYFYETNTWSQTQKMSSQKNVRLLQTPSCRVCMVCGWRREQMHTDYRRPVEKKGQYSYSLKMRVLQLLLSRGEHPDPCLDRLNDIMYDKEWKHKEQIHRIYMKEEMLAHVSVVAFSMC